MTLNLMRLLKVIVLIEEYHPFNNLHILTTHTEACLQLGVSSLSKSDFTSVDKDDTKVALSHKKVQTGRPHSRSSPQLDEHNEVCDVCEKGGDLLCCETCTLVFHLKCLRPKLLIIPKNKWSCPHCVLDVIIPFLIFFFSRY